MADKNYLTELRDTYIDCPAKVFSRFIVFMVIVLAIHFFIGGEYYGAVAVGAIVCFFVAKLTAFLINKKWPRTNFE